MLLLTAAAMLVVNSIHSNESSPPHRQHHRRLRLRRHHHHYHYHRSQQQPQQDIVISDLARRTKNFTGAEIAGLCRSTASFALNRQVDPLNPTKRPDLKSIKIVPADFEAALKEVGAHTYTLHARAHAPE